MATKFNRNADGTYTAKFLGGHVATITKHKDRWSLKFGKGKRGKTTWWWTLRDAKDEAEELARTTTTTVKNLMSGKSVKISVDTPHCCNPATETYWSM